MNIKNNIKLRNEARKRRRNQLYTTRFRKGIRNYMWFFQDFKRYKKMDGAEPIKFKNLYPMIHDRTSSTPFDSHYFYQGVWAAKRITNTGCKEHIDIGSSVLFVGFLSIITKVISLDIRPFIADVENLVSVNGSILEIPYESDTIGSLSCLHVAEHIGLGRYGNPLDPHGTAKATKELARVLKPGGNLFFSVPIGKPRLCFNAHRIHSTQQILDYFSDLTLVEISGVTDNAVFTKNIERETLDSCNYGCGLFWFTKK